MHDPEAAAEAAANPVPTMAPAPEVETEEEAAARQAEFERQRAEYEEERQRREEQRRQQFEQEQAEMEAERNRRAEILKARHATFERITGNAPSMFNAAQLRIFLRALCNLDPYTITDDVAEHFAGDNENNQQTAEEILSSALSETPDDKLTSFALRLALTGYVGIPRESEFDFLAGAAAAFVPPPPAKKKPKANKPTAINATAPASPKARTEEGGDIQEEGRSLTERRESKQAPASRTFTALVIEKIAGDFPSPAPHPCSKCNSKSLNPKA